MRKTFVVAGFAMLLVAVGGVWLTYQRLGKTPPELLDYVDDRLKGHSRLEGLAAPVLRVVRDWFDAVPLAQRRMQPFVIPPLSPLDRVEPAAAAAPSPAVSGGRILRVGRGQLLMSIAEASKVARDGDTVEIESGEYFGEVAVWSQRMLTVRGVNGRARLYANARSAEGKAIWVIRNGSFVVENIEFVGAQVADRNGAGIRFEGGSLHVRNCLFWANQNGLLTASGKAVETAELIIEDSEFAYNGAGDGQSHNLYVGSIGSLTVTGSYFHHANVGHLVKSRARRNLIVYNRLTDESGGRASYELDFPNGGEAIVVGNLIQQVRDSENSTVISAGEEGDHWPASTLAISNNTIVNEISSGGNFVHVAGSDVRLLSANNLLVGAGKFSADGLMEQTNDDYADWGSFQRAARLDFALSSSGREHRRVPALELERMYPQTVPVREYVHPVGTRALHGPAKYAGAFQNEP